MYFTVFFRAAQSAPSALSRRPKMVFCARLQMMFPKHANGAQQCVFGWLRAVLGTDYFMKDYEPRPLEKKLCGSA